MVFSTQIVTKGKKYSCIIFDLDGTLINTKYAFIKAFQAIIYQKTGRNIPGERLEILFGIPAREILDSFGIQTDGSIKWTEALPEFDKHTHLFPGVYKSIYTLSMCVEVGIITSRLEMELRRSLEYFRLFDFFHHLVCTDHTCRHKPDPEPLQYFLKISGRNANEVLYIGDTTSDLECAKACSVDFGLAAWAVCSRELKESSTYVFHSPMNVLKHLGITSADERR